MSPLGTYYAQEQPDFIEKPSTSTFIETPGAPSPGFGLGTKAYIPSEGAGKKKRLVMIGVIIAVVAVLAVVSVAVVPRLVGRGTSTVSTVPQGSSTTVTVTLPPAVRVVSACGTPINSPGTYRLASTLKYTSLEGACLNITSSDVRLDCNENQISGSGPFSDVPPFTYGIIAKGVSNVEIVGCIVSNFSYGVMMSATNDFLVEGSNVSSNYLSNVYLNGSSNGNVSNNYMAQAKSGAGSLYISSGSDNNTILNNSVVFNTFYGITVNGTGERFLYNHINYTPTSFLCSGTAGFEESSSASGNVCYSNNGCGFLSCKELNLPPNISRQQLGSSITSCGSIEAPGTYSLDSNISMSDYVNLSILEADHIRMPCINVAASGVSLNCGNHTISNASIGVQFMHGSALRLDSCRFRNSGYGVLLGNTTVTRLNNVTASGGTYGVAVINSTADFVTSVNAINNTYGVYLLGSQDIGINIFNLSLNNYGIYVSNSVGDVFANGRAVNNSVMDVYASSGYTNSSFESMSSTLCGLTNAQWATCHRHMVAQNYTELAGCGPISQSGIYHLTHNLLNASQCIRITANNVALNCENNSISALAAMASGYGINATNVDNVSLTRCRIIRFPEAVVMSNVTGFSIANVLISRSNYAISVLDSRGGAILNNTVNMSTNTSILLSNTRATRVVGNRAISASAGSGTGIALRNATHNSVLNNTAEFYAVGMEINGSSLNNTVSYNRMSSSSTVDYSCSPGSSGLAAENGGINYGVTKSGCTWMAMLPSNSTSLQCTAAITPSSISITSDGVYGVGSTCFSIEANHSTINCNYHTVLATDGGAFASFRNNVGSEIENCYLKGFTTAITGYNTSTVNIVNNTILENTTSLAKGQPAINISYSTRPSLKQNKIMSVASGIQFNNVTDGFLLNNVVDSVGTGFTLKNATGIEINYDSALNASAVGMLFENSTESTLQGNLLGGALVCTGGAQSSIGNIDDGSNSCSSNSECSWISKSSTTCH